jgi:hypothetical protein
MNDIDHTQLFFVLLPPVHYYLLLGVVGKESEAGTNESIHSALRTPRVCPVRIDGREGDAFLNHIIFGCCCVLLQR